MTQSNLEQNFSTNVSDESQSYLSSESTEQTISSNTNIFTESSHDSLAESFSTKDNQANIFADYITSAENNFTRASGKQNTANYILAATSLSITDGDRIIASNEQSSDSIFNINSLLENTQDTIGNSRRSKGQIDERFIPIQPGLADSLFTSKDNNLPAIAGLFHKKGRESLLELDSSDNQKPQIYVSNSARGDTNSSPGSKENPYRSIQQAINSSQGPVSINVMSGSYSEHVKVSRSDITIRTDLQNPAIIQNGGTAFSIGDSISNVRLSGFEIRGSKGSDAAVMISGRNINNITVDNMNIHSGTTEGIAVWGRGNSENDAIRKVNIISNTIHDLRLGKREALPINGNVDDFVVRGNIGYGNDNIFIDLIGGERTSSTKSVNQARNGLVEYNFIDSVTTTANSSYGNSPTAAGIYSDAGRDSTIRYNYINNSDFGIELGSEHGGYSTTGTEVYGNVIANSKSYWMIYGGPGSGGASDNVARANLIIGKSSMHKQNNASSNDISNSTQKIYKNYSEVSEIPAGIVALFNKQENTNIQPGPGSSSDRGNTNNTRDTSNANNTNKFPTPNQPDNHFTDNPWGKPAQTRAQYQDVQFDVKDINENPFRTPGHINPHHFREQTSTWGLNPWAPPAVPHPNGGNPTPWDRARPREGDSNFPVPNGDGSDVAGMLQNIINSAERTARSIGSVGYCAKGVRIALDALGLKFRQANNNPYPNAVELGRAISNHPYFEKLALSEARPGDIIVRDWNYNIQRQKGENNGDIVVVTGVNSDGSLRGANDHINYRIPPDGGRYINSYVVRYRGPNATPSAMREPYYGF